MESFVFVVSVMGEGRGVGLGRSWCWALYWTRTVRLGSCWMDKFDASRVGICSALWLGRMALKEVAKGWALVVVVPSVTALVVPLFVWLPCKSIVIEGSSVNQAMSNIWGRLKFDTKGSNTLKLLLGIVTLCESPPPGVIYPVGCWGGASGRACRLVVIVICTFFLFLMIETSLSSLYCLCPPMPSMIHFCCWWRLLW